MISLKISTRKTLVYFKIMSGSEDITLFFKIISDPNSRHMYTFGLQKPHINYQANVFFRIHIEYGMVF